MFFVTTPIHGNYAVLYNATKQRILVTNKFSQYYKLVYNMPTPILCIKFVYQNLYMWNYVKRNPDVFVAASRVKFPLQIYHPIYFQHYIKITIKSKIYRLYVNQRSDLVKSHLNFGHIIRTPVIFTTCLKLTKYKLLIFGLTYCYLKMVGLRIVNTRPYNIFTARGFRLSRSFVYKKVGKVSAYR